MAVNMKVSAGRPLVAGFLTRSRRPCRVAGAAVAVLALLLVSPSGSLARGADGRFDRRTSANFVLYQDVAIDQRTGWRGSAQFEREVLAALESAHDALRDVLGIAPRRSVVVTVYDPQVFDTHFAGLAAFPVAGFYAGSIRVRGDVRLTAALERVLFHEYVHAALDAAAPSLVLPALVNEGLAEWFARRSLGLPLLDAGEAAWLATAATSGGWLPLATLLGPGFAQLSPQAATLAYLESRAFVTHLVGRHGERALVTFWRTLTRTGRLDRALARAFDSDLAQIEARMLVDLTR